MLESTAQHRRVPPQTVNTEHEIQQCSDNRGQPDETHPGDRRSRIPLIKDGMPSRGKREQQRHGRKNDVPGVVSQMPEGRHNYNGK